MKREKSCGAVVYRKINGYIEFLAIKSNALDEHWGFPKGHVEEGETEEETCKREVYEETGLIIVPCNGFKACDSYQLPESTYKEVVFFIGCITDQAVVIQEDEVKEYKWASFNEIYNLLTYDSAKNILLKAKDFLDKEEQRGVDVMDITLEKASINQKSILRNLLELYNYDFTEFDPEDVDEHGLYGYKYLDHYWTEENRYPFLIRLNSNLVGFVLVRKIGTNSFNNSIYSIAEFFVMKKYRKVGIGKRVANIVFNMFQGEWKVAQIENNVPAQCFWRAVISEYTRGQFEEIRESDWNGPIQKFTNI